MVEKEVHAFAPPEHSLWSSSFRHFSCTTATIPRQFVFAQVSVGLKEFYKRINNKRIGVCYPVADYKDVDEDKFFPSLGSLLADRYKITGIIGEGQSAILVKAQDTFHPKEREVAIKVLHASYINLGPQEVSCLLHIKRTDVLKVANIIELLNMFIVGHHYCMVFELLRPTPLYQYFQRWSFPEKLDKIKLIKKIAFQVVQALGMLSSINIIHADLKPENILFTNGDENKVKLIDFGNALYYSHDEISLYFDEFDLQTIIYRAPEVMFGLPFSHLIDMWSLGCVLAEFFLGEPLFLGSSKEEILEKMRTLLGPLPTCPFQSGKFFPTLKRFVCQNSRSVQSNVVVNILKKLGATDYVFADFIAKLLTYDPSTRLDAFEAMRHPFLASECAFGYFLPSQNKSDSGCSYSPLMLTTSSYSYQAKMDEQVKKLQYTGLQLLRVGTESTSSVRRNIAKVVPFYCKGKTSAVTQDVSLCEPCTSPVTNDLSSAEQANSLPTERLTFGKQGNSHLTEHRRSGGQAKSRTTKRTEFSEQATSFTEHSALDQQATRLLTNRTASSQQGTNLLSQRTTSARTGTNAVTQRAVSPDTGKRTRWAASNEQGTSERGPSLVTKHVVTDTSTRDGTPSVAIALCRDDNFRGDVSMKVMNERQDRFKKRQKAVLSPQSDDPKNEFVSGALKERSQSDVFYNLASSILNPSTETHRNIDRQNPRTNVPEKFTEIETDAETEVGFMSSNPRRKRNKNHDASLLTFYTNLNDKQNVKSIKNKPVAENVYSDTTTSCPETFQRKYGKQFDKGSPKVHASRGNIPGASLLEDFLAEEGNFKSQNFESLSRKDRRLEKKQKRQKNKSTFTNTCPQVTQRGHILLNADSNQAPEPGIRQNTDCVLANKAAVSAKKECSPRKNSMKRGRKHLLKLARADATLWSRVNTDETAPVLEKTRQKRFVPNLAKKRQTTKHLVTSLEGVTMKKYTFEKSSRSSDTNTIKRSWAELFLDNANDDKEKEGTIMSAKDIRILLPEDNLNRSSKTTSGIVCRKSFEFKPSCGDLVVNNGNIDKEKEDSIDATRDICLSLPEDNLNISSRSTYATVNSNASESAEHVEDISDHSEIDDCDVLLL